MPLAAGERVGTQADVPSTSSVQTHSEPAAAHENVPRTPPLAASDIVAHTATQPSAPSNRGRRRGRPLGRAVRRLPAPRVNHWAGVYKLRDRTGTQGTQGQKQS